MKCLRCGYCCKNMMVVIVDDPDKEIAEDNLITHLGEGKSCKHLVGDTTGEYSCAIHDKLWYKETPCFAHGQIENNVDDVCRMGEYILSHLELFL